MMQSSLSLVFCLFCAILHGGECASWRVPQSWSAAVESARQNLDRLIGAASNVAAELEGRTLVSGRGRALDSGSLRGAEVRENRAGDETKMGSAEASEVEKRRIARKAQLKLRSVLASEVGIVHKTEYWGKVFVGTPAKEFTVIFDTGSGNLILPSSNCASAACQSHERYDPTKSKTSVQVGKLGKSLQDSPSQKKEATIRFGTGKIHGQFYQDKLCLGQDSACMDANFIGTDYESEMPFDSCSFDGIMGLGFKDLSMGQGFNMIDDVVSQRSLPSNKFSIYLTDAGGSEISFGGYKRSQVASDVFWTPVTRESYWQIGIDDVTFNNAKTGLCSKCQVAVDSGTSLLAGPSDVIEQLGDKLDLKEDCSNYHSMPLLGFALGDKVLNLKPVDYIDKAAGHCSLSFMTLDVPPPKGPLFIFGDPFLRRFLTIYDRDGPRVGFAVAQHKGVTSADAKTLIASIEGPKHDAPEDLSESTSEKTEVLATMSSRPGPKWSPASESARSPADDMAKLDGYTQAMASPAVTKAVSQPVPTASSESQSPVAGSGESVRALGTYTDPFDAVENENLSWGSIFKAFQEKSKKGAHTGMLQTTETEGDELVSISLARTKGDH